MKNSKGFALVEALLIFVIIGALAGVGWYVYQRQNSDNTEDSYTYGANISSESGETELEPDVTADWATYTPINELFSVKVPDGWTFEHGVNCDCLFTKTSEYIKGTQATITDTELDARDGAKGLFISYSMTPSGIRSFDTYTNQGEIATSGLTGTKYYFEQTEESVGIGLPKGGYEYVYSFEKDGKEIYISYSVYPGDADQADLVEKSIKTLK